MTTIVEYLKQAELALASYADLIAGVDPVPALTSNAVGMPSIQATHFSENWRVVDQYNVADNGLSATVFEEVANGVATGNCYLAIRGTENFPDYITDVIDITSIGARAALIFERNLILRKR